MKRVIQYLFAPSRPIWPNIFYKALALHIDQATPGGIH